MGGCMYAKFGRCLGFLELGVKGLAVRVPCEGPLEH